MISDDRRLKMLSKAEPRIAKLCGYQLKMVKEMGGHCPICSVKRLQMVGAVGFAAQYVCFQPRKAQHAAR